MISERLKLLREKKNETQAVIASALEIDRTTYNKYESGLSTPDAKMLEKLADYYDVSVDYILGRTDAVKHIVDLPDDYTVDPAKLVVFTRATQTLPEEEMNKIREYAAMLIDKQIKKEREEKKKNSQ